MNNFQCGCFFFWVSNQIICFSFLPWLATESCRFRPRLNCHPKFISLSQKIARYKSKFSANTTPHFSLPSLELSRWESRLIRLCCGPYGICFGFDRIWPYCEAMSNRFGELWEINRGWHRWIIFHSFHKRWVCSWAS